MLALFISVTAVALGFVLARIIQRGQKYEKERSKKKIPTAIIKHLILNAVIIGVFAFLLSLESIRMVSFAFKRSKETIYVLSLHFGITFFQMTTFYIFVWHDKKFWTEAVVKFPNHR